MAQKTKIEWTEFNWNPVRGCSRVSEGCKHCYVEEMAARFSGPGNWGEGLARFVTRPDGTREPRWTGKVVAAPDHVLLAPLAWKRPRLVFVDSTSDLFHEKLPDAVIDRVFAVMALTPHITYQILTKRSERLRTYLTEASHRLGAELIGPYERIYNAMGGLGEAGAVERHPYRRVYPNGMPWPLPNVWLGVSIEDQANADARVPDLLETPAAVRFVSAEPMLGALNLRDIRKYNPTGKPWIDALNGLVTRGQYLARSPDECSFCTSTRIPGELPGLDWVICGGESGREARPMHPQWARDLRDQCSAADVPFLFKQWGAWAPGENVDVETGIRKNASWFADKWSFGETDMSDPEADWMDPPDLFRVGKKAAGRMLDGVIHDGYPNAFREAA